MYTKAKQKNSKHPVKGEGGKVVSMPHSTFLCIKACVVCVYDPRSVFVILWEHSPCWTPRLNPTAQRMLLFVMDQSVFPRHLHWVMPMQGSWIWHCITSHTVALVAWHWKQLWVFSLQYNLYFCILGLIWSSESLIMKSSIYACV